jgi:hypothetical protein
MELINKIYRNTIDYITICFVLIKLILKNQKVHINSFKTHKKFILKNAQAITSWDVENYYKLEIPELNKKFTKETFVVLPTSFDKKKITLIAYGYKSKDVKTLKLETRKVDFNIEFPAIRKNFFDVKNNNEDKTIEFRNNTINLKQKDISLKFENTILNIELDEINDFNTIHKSITNN